MDEREWQINCFRIETGKTIVKESWINGKYAFLFAEGIVEKINIKFLEINVKWTNSWQKLTLMAIEIHRYMHY